MIIHHGSPKGLLLQLQVEPTWGSWEEFELGGVKTRGSLPRFGMSSLRCGLLVLFSTILCSRRYSQVDAEAAASRGEL